MFPLGGFSKSQVREISQGFELTVSSKKESQDVCFIAKDYRTFIEKNFKERKPKIGNIKSVDGEILGRHSGIQNFTIGQRKKLGVTNNKPLYVVSINYKNGDVLVGDDTDLYSSDLIATNLNWSINPEELASNKLKAKIRYRSPEALAKINFLEDKVSVHFDQPQRAITPGQAIVFYDDNKVVGGGWIDEVRE